MNTKVLAIFLTNRNMPLYVFLTLMGWKEKDLLLREDPSKITLKEMLRIKFILELNSNEMSRLFGIESVSSPVEPILWEDSHRIEKK